MSNVILKKRMMSFSLETLKDILGRELVDSLIEWNDSGPLMSKKKMVDMILNIYGVSILKNKEFREQLLKSFTPKELLELRHFLPRKYSTCEDLETIINKIVNSTWSKGNQVNEALLKKIELDPNVVFETKKNDFPAQNEITSYDSFYELLDYQYVIRQRALNILTSSNRMERFVIHMPTGTGKTKTAAHTICHYYNFCLNKKGLIIWIAHTKELLDQAYETFCNVWRNIGNGTINTYRLWGKYKGDLSDEINGFLVCSIQKLLSMKTNNTEDYYKLIKNARLVVYDEAHKAAAEQTRLVIEDFIGKRLPDIGDCSLMGLTATPGRSTVDSFDNNLIVSMFGNKIISIDTSLMNAINLSSQEAINTNAEKDIIKYFQNRGVLSHIKKIELTYANDFNEEEIKRIQVIATNNGYDDFSKKSLQIIGKNKSRNFAILKELRKLNYEKIPTIVFACSVQHGELLSSMLSLENIPNSLVLGKMNSQDRDDAIRRFKDKNDDTNIIINYEVLTTGFDSTNIGCVFITRPTQSVVLYSQMLGRGLRGPQMGGNKECLLIDIKDNLHKYNENMAFSHFDSYWNI